MIVSTLGRFIALFILLNHPWYSCGFFKRLAALNLRSGDVCMREATGKKDSRRQYPSRFVLLLVNYHTHFMEISFRSSQEIILAWINL